jgi:hypothetical protein
MTGLGHKRTHALQKSLGQNFRQGPLPCHATGSSASNAVSCAHRQVIEPVRELLIKRECAEFLVFRLAALVSPAGTIPHLLNCYRTKPYLGGSRS